MLQNIAALTKTGGLSYNAPDFGIIQDEDLFPHFKAAAEAYGDAALRIAASPAKPTFNNTVLALEQAKTGMMNAFLVIAALHKANTNPTRKEVFNQAAALLADVSNTVFQNEELFQRIKEMHQNENLNGEALRLTEKKYLQNFEYAGINLPPEQRERLKVIDGKLAELSSAFISDLTGNQLNHAVITQNLDDLTGLDEATLAGLKEDAEKADLPERSYVIYPINFTAHPLLEALENRPFRQRLHEAHTARGTNAGDTTWGILQELRTLRQEKANLLGFKNWAAFINSQETAGSVEDIFDLILPMAEKLNPKLEALVAELTQRLHVDGFEGPLQPWDFHYYAGQYQQEAFNFDPEALKPYFEFENVLNNGLFYAMEKLYGLEFRPRPDLPVYHADVRAYEVFGETGESIGLFYTDYFTRPTKQGGAWCSSLRQTFHANGQKPVAINVANIKKAPEGQPTLLSYDEVVTLFHEMGHALHVLFTQAQYASTAGTNTARDYVEVPSTTHEDWAKHPGILRNYARHYETGEELPQAMLDSFLEAINFSQLFDTYEYLAATVIDLAFYQMEDLPEGVDPRELAKELLQPYGMASSVVPPRYGFGYFAHIASGYPASYYSYIWSEVFAADWFTHLLKNYGGLNRQAGEATKTLLACGDSQNPVTHHNACRNQEPDVTHLLMRRGIA